MDLFEHVNDEELRITNNSELGCSMNGISVASIGAADEVVLVSPTPHGLSGLINLSHKFCSSRGFQDTPCKTHLLLYFPKKVHCDNPIHMAKKVLPLTEPVEQLGIMCNT